MPASWWYGNAQSSGGTDLGTGITILIDQQTLTIVFAFLLTMLIVLVPLIYYNVKLTIQFKDTGNTPIAVNNIVTYATAPQIPNEPMRSEPAPENPVDNPASSHRRARTGDRSD